MVEPVLLLIWNLLSLMLFYRGQIWEAERLSFRISDLEISSLLKWEISSLLPYLFCSCKLCVCMKIIESMCYMYINACLRLFCPMLHLKNQWKYVWELSGFDFWVLQGFVFLGLLLNVQKELVCWRFASELLCSGKLCPVVDDSEKDFQGVYR